MLSEKVTKQRDLEDQLFDLATAGRLPHAMLFTSQEGGGAMPLALKLAQYIFCKNKTAEQKACGGCNSCNSVQRLTHPDLFLTFPVYNKSKDSTKKSTSNDFITEFREFIIANPYASAAHWMQHITTENKQGNISADECRSIGSKLSLRPILGGAKILIIWYAEYLGKEGNILLKLIEEPPKNTFIMMVAEQSEDVLGTIQSRAQHYKLPKISSDKIKIELEKKGVDAAQAYQLAKKSEGNMHKALQLSEQTNTDYFNHLRNWLNSIYTNNGALMHGWLDASNAMSTEETKGFFAYVIHIFEQALRVQYLPEDFWSVTDAEARLIKGLINKGLKPIQCEKTTALCAKAIYHIERNVYKKVLLHAISFEVQEALVN